MSISLSLLVVLNASMTYNNTGAIIALYAIILIFVEIAFDFMISFRLLCDLEALAFRRYTSSWTIFLQLEYEQKYLKFYRQLNFSYL